MSIHQLDRAPNLRPGIAYAHEPESDAFVLFDLLTGGVFAINETGYDVLTGISNGRCIAEMAKSLSNNWGIAFEKAAQDVTSFLQAMDDRGLLIWESMNKLLEAYWAPQSKRNRERYGFPFTPGLVYWEFTNACNLRCNMCYNESALSRQDEITLAEKVALLEEFRSEGTTTLIITGGEPCCKPKELFEFLAACKSLGIAAEIFTNGTLVTDRVVQAFQEYDVKHIRVSIHGGRAETQDAITGIKGSFDRALAGVKRLKEAGLSVSWQMVVCRHNFSEMRVALEQAIELGLTGFRLGSLDLFGRGKALPEQQLSGEDEARTWRFLDEASMVYGSNIQLGWGADFCMEEPWKPYVLQPPERNLVNPADPNVFLRFCKSSLCGTAVRSIGLRADGTLIPCPALSELELGKARGNIKELWRTSPVLESLRQFDLQGFSDCRGCGMRYTCGAGCRASAYHVTGVITGPDPKRCNGNKALLKVKRSGFFTEDEITQGLAKMKLTSDRQGMKYINDVSTEGLGPWIPYWSIISSKWREKHLVG